MKQISSKAFAALAVLLLIAPVDAPASALDPVGAVHIPIGIPNSLDSLKTFVEAEGSFSPGIGSYGVYFWVHDPDSGRLISPTAKDVETRHGLEENRLLIPWSEWKAGSVRVRTEVCEVRQMIDQGDIYLVGSQAHLTNTGEQSKKISLYVALRPVGPAGFKVNRLSINSDGDALLVDGHAAIVADRKPASVGVLPEDKIGQAALRGEMPKTRAATSEPGDCSGALRFDLELKSGQTETLGFVCPVHAGKRAVRHQWMAKPNNYIDTAVPQSDAPGVDIPDAGLAHYRAIKVKDLFQQSRDDWRQFYHRVRINVPDDRWNEGFDVMLAHAGLCMNEGAADVAVLNYPVFNRDGMYLANMMQKAGVPQMSEAIMDYFLAHPFNGRPYPEADNPGQVLWSIGQHWEFTRDQEWLKRIYPGAKKLAQMIEYYRTTPGPYWVNLNRLEFGDALPADQRMRLEPGKCDGFHPEYTEAFDIAGMRVAARLAKMMGESEQAARCRNLASQWTDDYGKRFGQNLGKSYGSYSVLWPCRLFSLTEGSAHEQFKGVGKQSLAGWRYFAPATAHQGLLAGNREAGYRTVDLHLDHPQMRSWFAFDEGGTSGSGGWHHLRTTWPHSKSKPDQNHAVAMPHGWAIAEVWLLMRDCLAFEQDDQLVLLGGVPPDWLKHSRGIKIQNLPTYFGILDLRWSVAGNGANLELGGEAEPPGGFVLRLPKTAGLEPRINGLPVKDDRAGGYIIPPGTKTVRFR